MLASSWGQTGAMTGVMDDGRVIFVEPVEEKTTLVLDFYASKNQLVAKDKLVKGRAFAKGISPLRVCTIVLYMCQDN